MLKRFKKLDITSKLALTGSALVISGSLVNLAQNPREFVEGYNLRNLTTPIESDISYRESFEAFKSLDLGEKTLVLGVTVLLAGVMTSVYAPIVSEYRKRN